VFLALLLAAVPVVTEPAPDRPSELFLVTSALGGVSLLDVDADAGGTHRGPLAGVRVGLLATRPPLVLGGSRVGFFPALTLRHEFIARRTEWVGSMAFVTEFSRLFILSSVGYGLSLVGDVAPRHLLEVTAGVGLKFGSFRAQLEVSSLMRLGLGASNHTLQVVANVGWEFQLPG